MEYAAGGLMMIIGLAMPIATLVFVILIYNKVKKIEKSMSGQ
ncbi:MAG: hypothetical protein ABH870_07740 [bacterium]